MQEDDRAEQQWEPEHVESIEARQRGGSELRPALEQFGKGSADERCRAGDAGAYLRRPVGALIPREKIPGKAEPQHEKEEQHAEQPVCFSRILVRSRREYSHHVREHEHDHETCAPAVHAAQQRAESDLSLNELNAFVCVIRGRRIKGREDHTGDDLDEEDRQRRTAEGVPPGEAVRHVAIEERTSDALNIQTLIEPSATRRFRGLRHASSFAAIPGRKVSYWMCSSPFSTLTGRVSSPRGGGPPTTAPVFISKRPW